MSEFHVFGASLAAINTIRILLSGGSQGALAQDE